MKRKRGERKKWVHIIDRTIMVIFHIFSIAMSMASSAGHSTCNNNLRTPFPNGPLYVFVCVCVSIMYVNMKRSNDIVQTMGRWGKQKGKLLRMLMSSFFNFFHPACTLNIPLRHYLCPYLTIAFSLCEFSLFVSVRYFFWMNLWIQLNRQIVKASKEERDVWKGTFLVAVFKVNAEALSNGLKWQRKKST